MHTKQLAAAVIAAALSVHGAAYAATSGSEPFGMETVLGTTMDEVQATLVEMGYEIRKAEMEDGKIEVYFIKGGDMFEVYVDPETGLPTKIKSK